MKKLLILAASGAIACTLASGAQMIRYVSVDGTNNPPYTNWAGAATSIVVAVNAANANNAGDIVWISNGPHVVTATISIGNTKVRGFTGDYRDVIVRPSGPFALACFDLTNANAEVSALTISNAVGDVNGGGVRFKSNAAGAARPAGLLSNCMITACSAARGAAVMMAGSNNVMANCVIENNTSTKDGTIYFEDIGLAEIAHTWIRNNIASNAALTACGGGINVNQINRTFSDTTISGNSSYYANGGGGIYATQPAMFIRCQISSNRAIGSGTGGGICYLSSTAECKPVFSNCTIVGNAAGGSAGGMYIRASAILYNCLIAENTTAGGFGGGICFSKYTSTVHNCTIVLNSQGNTTADHGGGFTAMADSGNGMGILCNTIIYSNWINNATSVNSNYYTSWGNIFSNCCTVPKPTTGTGNITDKPGLRNMAADQFEPVAGSPCIDTGLNEAWMDGAVDMNGRQRLDRFTRRVDMGAYEYVYSGTLVGVR